MVGIGDLCDGCPNDPEKIDPGVCGCGIPDTDDDGDGVIDDEEQAMLDASADGGEQGGVCTTDSGWMRHPDLLRGCIIVHRHPSGTRSETPNPVRM